MLIFLVHSIGIEPSRALLHQMWPQRDVLGGNQFEELANRRERVAGADSDDGDYASAMLRATVRGTLKRSGLGPPQRTGSRRQAVEQFSRGTKQPFL